MFLPQDRATGVNYTPTITLLVLGLVFVPAFLLLFGAWDRYALAFGAVFSGTCLLLGWRTWLGTSRLTIPSILKRIGRTS